MDAKCDRGQNRLAVADAVAIQSDAHMVEAAASRLGMARHQRMMRAIIGQSLKRGEAVFRRHRPDRVHASANRLWSKARDAGFQFGYSFADQAADGAKRFIGHGGILSLT